MEKVFLIHGWEGTPTNNWFVWLGDELKKLNLEVLAPAMPNADYPKKIEWVDYLNNFIGEEKSKVHLVGHSLGCIAILRYLESKPDIKAGLVVLAAGFSESIGFDIIENFFDKPLDYELVKNKAEKFAVINSDNDPYVPLSFGELMSDKLGAELIIVKNGGHLNSDDGFRQLPQALEVFKEFLSK
jgi:predicted alpha/beta hydrolase family esterase